MSGMEPRGRSRIEGQKIWRGQRDGPTWGDLRLLFDQDPYSSASAQFVGLAAQPQDL